MESVTPEKQAEYAREFKNAFNDLEDLINEMIRGADAVIMVGMAVGAPRGNTEGNAVEFVGDSLIRCAAKLRAKWDEAHTAMIGGPEIVERQDREWKARLVKKAEGEDGQ